jgi:hypothetical protein
MFIYRQEQAGATNFDGSTAALGLLDFTTRYNFDNVLSIVPRLYSVSISSTAALDIIIRLSEPGGSATSRLTLANRTTVLDFDDACAAGRPVPRDGNTIYQLTFVTANKTAAATVTAFWGVEAMP